MTGALLPAAMITLLVAACGPAGPPGQAGVDDAGAADEATRSAPRHVLLVIIDSLRADHVGAYGYERPITPQLDSLAAEGLRFDRAYAASSARGQSLSALWTGRLPSAGGAVGLREATPHESLLSLPRRFLRAGRRTGLISNVPELRERAFTRGFDDVEVDSTPGRWTGGLVTAKALEILDAAGDDPSFLVVDYADASEPHLPLQDYRAGIDAPVPEQLLSLPHLRGLAGQLPADVREWVGFRDLVARYDAEIAYVDACLGALVAGLAQRERLDDTLLIVTSSHGIELLEHGYVGSAWTLYEESIRVPLVLRGPGIDAGNVVSDPVSLLDVTATLAELYALPAATPSRAAGSDAGRSGTGPPHDGSGDTGVAPVHGRSLLPGTTSPPDRGAVISELVIPELCILRAAMRAETKLIEVIRDAPVAHRVELAAGYDELIAAMLDGSVPRPDPFGQPVRRELYDLAADPTESADRSTSLRDRVAALTAVLADYAERVRAQAPQARSAARRAEPPDPATAEQLRQLGYL